MHGSSPTYRPEIDGLRAVAVLPVMAYHASIPGASGGFVGVDVFFVISGYLITRIIVGGLQGGTFTLPHFWERRARRILPALYLVLLACLVPALLLLMPEPLEIFGASIAGSPLFVTNFYFSSLTGYFDPALGGTPLIHLWSLSVEEQFYLFYPLVLLAIFLVRRQWILPLIVFGLIASLTLSTLLLGKHLNSWAFFLLPSRAWELLAGGALAFLPVRKIQTRALRQLGSLTGLALVIAPVFLYSENTPFPGIAALPPVLGTALILAFASSGTLVHKALTWRPLVGMGLISYSAYLWHQPILSLGQAALIPDLGLIARIALLAISLLLAWLSYRFVEQPFRRADLVSTRAVVISGVGLGLFLIAIGGQIWANSGFPQRVPASFQAFDTARRSDAQRITDCSFWPAGKRSLDKACAFGGGDATIAVIGDSHAAAIVPAIGDAAKAKGARAILLAEPGCPPWIPQQQATNRAYCIPHQQQVLRFLTDRSDIGTVVVAARWAYDLGREPFDNGEGGVEPRTTGSRSLTPDQTASVASGFRHLVNLLLRNGKTIVLVYPIPEAGWDVPAYMGRRYLLGGLPDASTSSARFVERNRAAQALLDSFGQNPRIRRFHPSRNLCNTIIPGRCIIGRDATPFYADDDHLTSQGARVALRGFEQVLP